MKIPIRFKITAIILLIILVTAFSINGLFIQTISSDLEDEIKAELSRDSFFMMQELDRFLFERQSDIQILTSPANQIINLELHTMEEILDYLRDFEKRRKAYVSISIYDLNGSRIGDTRGVGMHQSDADKPFFKEAIKGTIYSDPRSILSESLNIPVIHFSGPIYNKKNEIIGVLVTRVSFIRLNNILKEVKNPYHVYERKLNLLDKNGLILFSNHNGAGVLTQRLSGLEIFKQILNSNNSIETTIGIRNGNEELFVAVRQTGFLDYKGNDWLLVTSMSTSDVFKPIRNLQKKSLIVSMLIVLSSVPLSLLIARSFSVPIRKLREAADEFSKGNLNAEINIASQDEIGDLAKSFEQMALELKESKSKVEKHQIELEKQVRERTEQLEKNVEELELSKKATLNIMEDFEETNRELMHMQKELEASVSELKKLDTQKDQFISIAAHELKTPLTSIRGFTDLLQKEKIIENPELRSKYLGIIFRDTKRLSELISNILELSRMDIGTLKLAFEKVQVHDLVEEVKEQMEIIIKTKNLDSEFTVDENLPEVEIDKDRMVQVISNIINNAVHYTEKGKITVHVGQKDNSLLFSISDTGAGIPKDQQQKIFERFYQVDSHLTRKIGGTGLGLSLCKGFVEAHNGKIWLESEPGKGTTFYFTIPIEKREITKKEIKIIEKSAVQEQNKIESK